MELAISFDKHLAIASSLHTHLCPKQIIGVRMARFACRYLGIDPALKTNRRKLFVYMEIGHCVADGVMAVTRCSPLNSLMQLIDYGKVAATFLNLESKIALRVSENPQSKSHAMDIVTTISQWKAQLQTYPHMRDEMLLSWQEVELVRLPPTLPGKPVKVTCVRCGDSIHEHQERMINSEPVCKPCAEGAYFVISR